jgi:hypothetical protein
MSILSSFATEFLPIGNSIWSADQSRMTLPGFEPQLAAGDSDAQTAVHEPPRIGLVYFGIYLAPRSLGLDEGRRVEMSFGAYHKVDWYLPNFHERIRDCASSVIITPRRHSL